MRMSFRFRLGTVVCAAMLFIVAFSFISTPALADKAGNAAKAAERAVAQAEALAKECRELELLAGAADVDAQAAETSEAALGKPTTEEEKKLAGELAERARKARKEATAANAAARKKCGEAEEARKKAEEAIKKAEELLKEKTDRGGNVKDDENLDDKLKGLKERLPKKPEQATVIPPSAGQTAQTQTANGLHTIIFDTTPGQIKVYLPDDMRAGDTVSGTVTAEPKGQTEAERAQNLSGLNGSTIIIRPRPVPGKENSPPLGVKVSEPFNHFTITLPPLPDPAPPRKLFDLTLEDPRGMAISEMTFETPPMRLTEIATDLRVPSEKSNDFQLPTLGQQGRILEIPGHFDGDAANTGLTFKPPGDTGGPGPVRPLAESPRKIVFESPTNFTGPAEVLVREGDAEEKGNYRNLGVSLSAPKTNLPRGERTTLTVEVKGLEGIREDVPLQLDSHGVITMDGGNFQNLLITPQEVKPDGRYTTTRAITGQQAGDFSVTATVIVRRFDMCLQDDNNPRSAFMWNSFTGDYFFVNPPGAVQPSQPGGKLQPGGGGAAAGGAQTAASGSAPPKDPVPPPGGLNLTGIGKPAMKGCIITLSHNAPDRRVFARLDTCTKTGSGEVQQSAPKTSFDVKDGNISDSACPASR